MAPRRSSVSSAVRPDALGGPAQDVAQRALVLAGQAGDLWRGHGEPGLELLTQPPALLCQHQELDASVVLGGPALLQGRIETASKFNPMTAVVESGRGLMAGDPFHVILAFAAAASGAALLAVFARRGLRKAEAAG